jgi:hypothetical protein
MFNVYSVSIVALSPHTRPEAISVNVGLKPTQKFTQDVITIPQAQTWNRQIAGTKTF